MKLTLPDSLIALANEFAPDSLYAVGGFVRNSLMGSGETDIDICSYLLEGQIRAKNIDGLVIKPVNPRIGTLKLIYMGGEFEYTTFRYDNYPSDGRHTPDRVVFTRDIEADAKRRDFTVNAVYYDIGKEEFIDPVSGMADIRAGILRTADAADKTLSEDGLRILRMVRFAVSYDLIIYNETLAAAKHYVKLLSDISKERIRDEFLKILYADAGGMKDAHYKGLLLLDDIGAFPYIIPYLSDTKGAEQNTKYHLYDVFNHILMTVRYSPPEVRLAALFHDIAKPICRRKYGNNYLHSPIGSDIVYEVLGANGLKFTKSETARVAQLVKLHMYDIDMRASDDRLRIFVQHHYYMIDGLIALKRADYKAKGLTVGESPSVIRIAHLYDDMKAEGVPFAVCDLLVNGLDLSRLGYRYKEIGDGLKNLLTACANDLTLLTREAQLRFCEENRKELK